MIYIVISYKLFFDYYLLLISVRAFSPLKVFGGVEAYSLGRKEAERERKQLQKTLAEVQSEKVKGDAAALAALNEDLARCRKENAAWQARNSACGARNPYFRPVRLSGRRVRRPKMGIKISDFKAF